MTVGACSSVGRAPALQAGGQEFDSPQVHYGPEENVIVKIISSRHFAMRNGCPACFAKQAGFMLFDNCGMWRKQFVEL